MPQAGSRALLFSQITESILPDVPTNRNLLYESIANPGLTLHNPKKQSSVIRDFHCIPAVCWSGSVVFGQRGCRF